MSVLVWFVGDGGAASSECCGNRVARLVLRCADVAMCSSTAALW